jgi:hypothetical protein
MSTALRGHVWHLLLQWNVVFGELLTANAGLRSSFLEISTPGVEATAVSRW